MTGYQRGTIRASLAQQYAAYELSDSTGERIGRVAEIFVDESGRPEYVGVDGVASAAGLALIPCERVRVDEERGVMETSEPRDRILSGPAFKGGMLSRDYEERLRQYYGLDRMVPGRWRGLRSESVETGQTADSSSASARSGSREGSKFLLVCALALVAVVALRAAYRRRRGWVGDADESRVNRSSQSRESRLAQSKLRRTLGKER